MHMQRRPVAHQPDMPEGIDKSSLPVNAPGRLVILYFIETSVSASRYRPRNESIRIIAEYFYPC
jgi:hypothetical protein